MTMITPSYLGETIEYSSLHACRSTLEDPTPLMRPVFYDYPEAVRAPCDTAMTFLLGDRLLVAPSPDPESARPYDVCLPAGGWFDYWTGAQPPSGRAEAASQSGEWQIVKVTPALDQLPVYVRAGAILPLQPLVQSTAQTPQGNLTLAIYPGDKCSGTLYLDDGHSMAYQRGAFLRQTVRCTVTADGLTVQFDGREGSFRPWWTAIDVVVHGWEGAATGVLAGDALPLQIDTSKRTLRLSVPDQATATTVTIRRTGAPRAAAIGAATRGACIPCRRLIRCLPAGGASTQNDDRDDRGLC